jgi:hypothetical protein
MMDKIGCCSLAVAWIAGCFMCRVQGFDTWILFVCFIFMCLQMGSSSSSNYVSTIVTVTAPVNKSENWQFEWC